MWWIWHKNSWKTTFRENEEESRRANCLASPRAGSARRRTYGRAASHALPPGAHPPPPPSRPRPAEGPTCSEMALKRQEASFAVSLRYRPRLPRYSSIVTSLSDFCPKYFFQPFCIVPGRRRGRGSSHSTGEGSGGRQWGSTLGAPRCGRSRCRARLERGDLVPGSVRGPLLPPAPCWGCTVELVRETPIPARNCD